MIMPTLADAALHCGTLLDNTSRLDQAAREVPGGQDVAARMPFGRPVRRSAAAFAMFEEGREETQVDLKSALPHLLARAISWAEAEATRGADVSRELSERERELARKVGVTHPERIRVVAVAALRSAAEQTGFLDPGMVGLTLGYSVFICHGHETVRLLSHEFRHVYQYEQAGSVAAFLPGYLLQIVERGYTSTTFEIDARAHERTDL